MTKTPPPLRLLPFAGFALLLMFALTLPMSAGPASSTAPKPTDVTFSEHIAPLVHEHCASCHRPGEAAPFSLITYNDVRKRARTIQRVVSDRYMPPWHPVPGHGAFVGERRLTEAEIARFDAWVEAGKPEGDPKLAPKAPAFPEGWQLGEPDLVVQVARPFDVPADGPDIYRSFVIPLDLEEDRWVKAIELRPEARSVVHHVLYFLDDSGTAREKDGQDGKAGFRGMGFRISGRLGGYAPGSPPGPLPEDLAWPLPAGSDLVLQTHFHPVGKAETEQLTVGIFFADEPPARTMVGIQVPPGFGRGMGIDIPPGESDYKIEDTFVVPCDIEAYQVGGHAHYVCQQMTMTATLPDGRVEPLLRIDDWDLNWQDRYIFAEPVSLPAGTVLKTELVYDNSAKNPDNPFDPPRRVKWGRESTDEMGSITLTAVAADESETKLLLAATRLQQTEALGGRAAAGFRKILANLPAMIEQADKSGNGDGKLQKDEVSSQRMRRDLFERWDADKDGVLDEGELETLFGVVEKVLERSRGE